MENVIDVTPDEALVQALDQLFQLAQRHIDAGERNKAADCYQMILQHAPQYASANFGLGLLLADTDAPLDSLPYFEAAIQTVPDKADYWDAYIAILRAVGDEAVIEGAVQLRAQCIPSDAAGVEILAQEAPQVTPQPITNALEPTLPKATVEVNRMARLYEDGKLVELEQFARRLINKNAAHGLALRFLGITLFDLHRPKDALTFMQKAVRALPKDAIAHFNLALCCAQLKDYANAEQHYRRATALDPNLLEAFNNLGNLLTAIGRVDEAIVCFTDLTTRFPQFILGHLNLANAYKTKKDLPRAKFAALTAVKLNSDLAEARNALGGILFLCDEFDEAQQHLERAISLKSDFADAYSNLGTIFFQKADYAKAKPLFEKAIQLDPTIGSAYRCLAHIAMVGAESQGKSERYLRRALELNPKDDIAHTSLLFLLSEKSDISPEDLFKEHQKFGIRFERDLKPRWITHHNDRSPNRRLRIGFVSGDFCNHAVATFFMPVLEQLVTDDSIELFAYDNHGIVDEVAAKFRSLFHHWRTILHMPDGEVANAVVTDQIDILFDLSGHTAKNRLTVFAHKPAPVQATWMGYPGTTGLTAMDYMFYDRHFLPEGQFDHLFIEKIVRLPANAPFSPYPRANSVNELPALKNGYLTFGSFNRVGKISPEVIQVWSALLREVPDSRLFFGAMPQDTSYQHIVDAFEKAGVLRERLSFFGRCGMDLYLNQLQKIDICLDTFPYNGGTTTLHGLWMGVPTITKSGLTVAGRTGAAMLSHVGLQRMIASSNDQFVLEGKYWSEHLQELADLRTVLRQRMAASALLQPELIGASLVKAIRFIWTRWCARLPAVSFEITEIDLKGEAEG